MKRVQGVLRNRGLLYFYMPTSKDIIYYTDEHNVDEDMMTIIDQGGSWFYGIEAGVMERHLNDFLSLMTGEVASYV